MPGGRLNCSFQPAANVYFCHQLHLIIWMLGQVVINRTSNRLRLNHNSRTRCVLPTMWMIGVWVLPTSPAAYNLDIFNNQYSVQNHCNNTKSQWWIISSKNQLNYFNRDKYYLEHNWDEEELQPTFLISSMEHNPITTPKIKSDMA